MCVVRNVGNCKKDEKVKYVIFILFFKNLIKTFVKCFTSFSYFQTFLIFDFSLQIRHHNLLIRNIFLNKIVHTLQSLRNKTTNKSIRIQYIAQIISPYKLVVRIYFSQFRFRSHDRRLPLSH